MKVLYFDCFSGVSGDMILGALVDAGLPADSLAGEIEKLGIEGISLSFEKVTGTGGLGGTRARVQVEEQSAERSLSEIQKLIRASRVDAAVQDRACRIFERLAEAEAFVHRTTADKIHFHEVGALDAIADIVGAAAGLRLLGVERVYSSRLRFGTGTVRCRHGVLPVPAPAVVRLAEGVPVEFTSIEGELTTPTGAAIITTVAERIGVEIDLVPESVGYGFGSRERAGLPNALRVVLGRPVGAGRVEQICLLEANLDDAPGEDLGYLMERCFEAGAADVFFTPVQMKKNRPGTMVSVLCTQELQEPLSRLLAEESGTLGIRISRVSRTVADRSVRTVDTAFGPIRIKEARFPGGLGTWSPEFEDLARLARRHGLPLRIIRQKIEADIAAAADDDSAERGRSGGGGAKPGGAPGT